MASLGQLLNSRKLQHAVFCLPIGIRLVVCAGQDNSRIQSCHGVTTTSSGVAITRKSKRHSLPCTFLPAQLQQR